MKRLMMLGTLALMTATADAQRLHSTSKSADGVAFPTAVERRFKHELPAIGTRLGALPSEFSRRIFSSEESRDLLRRNYSADFPHDWFALKVSGANVAGFDMRDGRVCRAALYFKSLSNTRLRRVEKQLSVLTVSAAPDGWLKLRLGDVFIFARLQGAKDGALTKGPVTLSYELDQTEWDLLYGKIPRNRAASARAMRDRVQQAIADNRPCKGMTVEQAVELFGEPDSVNNPETEGREYSWVLYRNVAVYGRRLKIKNFPVRYRKELDRIINATIKDGVIIAFTDSNY